MVGGLESGSKAVLGLVFEYRRVVLVLELDLRLSILGLDSYSAKAVLVPSLVIDT